MYIEKQHKMVYRYQTQYHNEVTENFDLPSS
jgi:hypothetical protein